MPLPSTGILGDGNGLTITMVLAIAYLYTPEHFAETVAQERSLKLKHQLVIMGCRISAYWIVHLIVDYIAFLASVVVCAVPMFLFGIAPFTGYHTPELVALLVTFPFAILAFSYAFAFAFSANAAEIFMARRIFLLEMGLSTLRPWTKIQG